MPILYMYDISVYTYIATKLKSARMSRNIFRLAKGVVERTLCVNGAYYSVIDIGPSREYS